MSDLPPTGADSEATAGAAQGADVVALPLPRPAERPDSPSLPEKLVEGYIDAINGCKISGWAWCRSAPLFAVEVEVRVGERIAAVVRADLPRADLAKAGLGDGRHGFSVLLDDPVAEDARAGVSAFVRRTPEGGRVALINRAARTAAPVSPASPPEPAALPSPAAFAGLLDEKLERLGRKVQAGIIAAVTENGARERAALATELEALRREVSRLAGGEDLRAAREEIATVAATAELLQLRLDAVQAAVAGEASAARLSRPHEKGLILVVAVLAVVSAAALALGLVAVLL